MRIAVGLSGGVDSTVAAWLLKAAGHEVTGVTMTLGRADEAESLSAAEAAAARLKVPLEVLESGTEWRELVVGYLRDEYLAGRTPNPCVRCNEAVKFSLLPRWAFRELGVERYATGHYARLSGEGPVMRLARGCDRAKDQSYFLYRAPPEVLSRTLFPLGELTKAAVREIAVRERLVVAERGESQDFCGGDVHTMVARPPESGRIVTLAGEELGRHSGYWNFTVGMRKGLGVGGGTPYYVVALDAERNEVVVAPRSAALRREAVVGALVVFDGDWLRLAATAQLAVKVRSAGEPRAVACVERVGEDRVRFELVEPVLGIAPGQSAVFYHGDEVVAGGVILQSFSR